MSLQGILAGKNILTIFSITALLLAYICTVRIALKTFLLPVIITLVLLGSISHGSASTLDSLQENAPQKHTFNKTPSSALLINEVFQITFSQEIAIQKFSNGYKISIHKNGITSCYKNGSAFTAFFNAKIHKEFLKEILYPFHSFW